MKNLVLMLLALSSPAIADTRADRALDSLPRYIATERAPGYIDRVNRIVNNLPLTDCKAQAFEKLRRLSAYGIGPDRAMFVAVRTETGAYHAIAVVDRKWALDGRQVEVVTVDDLRREGYQIAALN
jgi:hypothetical protein